jgi:hypothetical protein
MKKPHKHTRRGFKYHTVAEGYKILKSPLADSYNAAAEHFSERDPAVDETAIQHSNKTQPHGGD